MSLNTEMIVKKKQKISPKIISIGLFAIAAIITAVLFKVAGAVAFMPLPVFLTAAFLLSRYFKITMNVEYEYAFIDGTFTVTKLLNQEKRVPVVQTEVNEITGFGRAAEENLKEIEHSVVKTVRCCTEEDDDEHYYFICKHDDDGVHAFVFTPDEKMLKLLSGRNQIIASALRKTY